MLLSDGMKMKSAKGTFIFKNLKNKLVLQIKEFFYNIGNILP